MANQKEHQLAWRHKDKAATAPIPMRNRPRYEKVLGHFGDTSREVAELEKILRPGVVFSKHGK